MNPNYKIFLTVSLFMLVYAEKVNLLVNISLESYIQIAPNITRLKSPHHFQMVTLFSQVSSWSDGYRREERCKENTALSGLSRRLLKTSFQSNGKFQKPYLRKRDRLVPRQTDVSS